MSTHRTPTSKKDVGELPTGRLGALTRKKNQIEEEMTQNKEFTVERMQVLLEEYNLKLANFQEAVALTSKSQKTQEEKNNLKEWFNTHYSGAEYFLEQINKWLEFRNSQGSIRPDDSISQVKTPSKISGTSRCSEASGTSSYKLKVAEAKNKLLIEQEFILEKRKLEEKDMKLKAQMEDLELLKKARMVEAMEQTLETMSQTKNSQMTRPKTKSKFEDQLSGINKLSMVDHPEFGGAGKKIKWEVKEDNSQPRDGWLVDAMDKILTESQNRATLPKHEPETFSGSDCTKYRSFVRSFEQIIETKCHNAVDRQFYLEKYTSGLAHQLVVGSRSDNPAHGYIRAKQALEEEFGNQFKVTSHYINKIETWEPIKPEDGKSLQQLSLFLRSCANIMEDSHSLDQLNNPIEIKKVIGKLPYKMRDAWRRRAMKIHDRRSVNFADLSDFIKTEVKCLNQPLFGNITTDDKEMKTQKIVTKKAFPTNIILAGQQKTNESSCIVCKKTNHTIDRCYFFMKKPHDEKIKFLQGRAQCFACLGTGHMAKYCKYKIKCDKCLGIHPTILHQDRNTNYLQKAAPPVIPAASTEYSEETSVTGRAMNTKTIGNGQCTGAGTRIVCPAIPVKVRIPGREVYIVTYMGLDSYCSDVFVSQNLLNKLGATGYRKKITLSTMHQKEVQTDTQVINNLQISDLYDNENTIIPVAYCGKTWPFTKEDTPKPEDLQFYPYLQEIPFNFVEGSIDILVGLNQPHIMRVLGTVYGPKPESPFATQHKFGWALNGPVSSEENSDIKKRCYHIKVEDNDDISETFRKLCSQEFKDEDTFGPSVEDQEWQKKIESSLRKLPDGHYEVALPFKNRDQKFPSNRQQVLSRLMSSKRKLKTNPQYHKDYSEFMDMMLKNGFSESVPENQLRTPEGKHWYLFHFGVHHKQKGKLRVVFHAALKFKGISLNDCLMQGPDLTSGLLGVLLRFRQEPVGMMADIRKMFYMVKVPDYQKDYLRYLWFPNGDLQSEPQEYRVIVHIFGAVSSPSVANYVLRHAATDVPSSQFSREAKQSVLRNFYVDDLAKSVRTESTAVKILSEVTDLVAGAGFELTGYVSNSIVVLLSLPREVLAGSFKDVDLGSDDLPIEKVLGVKWNTQEDEFGFKVKKIEPRNTKRTILSTIFSFYDPMGLASPIILTAKSIFQKTCHLELGWDDPLPKDILNWWLLWKNTIHDLETYSMPRCVKPARFAGNLQLHIFCDGSEIGYATAAYLRSDSGEGPVSSLLVMSKTRLVPLRGTAVVTIPRIELNGAKLAVQLGQTLEKEFDLQMDQVIYWTDSTTVLTYINNRTTRFKRFVSNRVSFIRNYTNPNQWRHVPGLLNPADLASRGTNTTAFAVNEMWKFGPPYLMLDEDQWPILQHLNELSDDDQEIKKEKKKIFITKNNDDSPIERILKSSCNWTKVLYRVTWILKFGRSIGNKKKKIKETPFIGIQEVKDTTKRIWRYLQKQRFFDTINRLESHKDLRRDDSLLKLNPYLDDQSILRVGGRLQNIEATYDQRHPIILPSDHHCVRLLTNQTHHLVGHMGKETVMAEIRTKYWIPGLGRLVKSVLNDCLICRKRHNRPCEQIMADLPAERVPLSPHVFENIGIDCFGPFLTRRGRTNVKRYGVIFSCLASRAAHLEILEDMSTTSFINALFRFSARRGYPSIIRCDNGTNFVGAEKELRNSLRDLNDDRRWRECLLQKQVEWKFQPPAASHFGGIWEREIRTIRKILGSLTREQPFHLSTEGLTTLMCEIESTLNSRPLTAISDDPNDLEALTPNHLLLAYTRTIGSIGNFEADDCYVRKRWRHIQHLADQFWKRWRREYVPLLQQRQKWNKRRPSLQIGDLVLVVDQLLPRNQWSLGRITAVKADYNQDVRSASVRIAKVRGELRPGFGTTILDRPVDKLIYLKHFK